MTLQEYLAKWDPIFLVESGAPLDEYAAEAREIKLRYTSQLTDAQLTEMICAVFQEYLEVSAADLLPECARHLDDIRKILDTETTAE